MAAARPNAASPLPRSPSPATSGSGRSWLPALGVVVAVAVVLRALRLGHGLPDVVEEEYPFRIALGMWGWETGRTDWNPHFFAYPSLSFYAHFLMQKVAVGIGILTGRYTNAADYRLAFETDPTSMMLLA